MPPSEQALKSSAEEYTAILDAVERYGRYATCSKKCFLNENP